QGRSPVPGPPLPLQTGGPPGAGALAKPVAGAAAGAGAAAPLTLPPSAGPAEAAPGLRLAPQAPVGPSGHNLATALQTAGSVAAATAAGRPPLELSAGPATAGAVKLTGLVTATTSG